MSHQYQLPPPEAVESLLTWYRKNARDLPWRKDVTPYRVWISEIMLQQTRVEAVKPYFHRFLEAFPDVYALAEADDTRLMKLWEGLGYYSRARNLKKAAIRVTEDYGGSFPADYKELQKLPGIGSYTAGAIATIAFGIPAPAVDGNVLRVLSRVAGDSRDIMDPRTKKSAEEAVLQLCPARSPGDFTQAMIELGATLCGPNTEPCCASCPMGPWCIASREESAKRYFSSSWSTYMLRALHTQRRSMYGGQSTHRDAAPRGIISRLESLIDPKLVTLRHFRPIHHTKRSKSCEHFARMIGDDFFEFAQLPRT